MNTTVENIEKQISYLEELTKNLVVCKYFKANKRTSERLVELFGKQEFVSVTGIGLNSLIYRGIDVVLDNRLKNGDLKAYMSDGTIINITVPAKQPTFAMYGHLMFSQNFKPRMPIVTA